MDVALRGSTPAATTAGILILTRARQLGLPIRVSVVADPKNAERVLGPAVLYAPVLASCGVGRDAGHGGLVVVPGPPDRPIMMTATPHGLSGWFFVDRAGHGHHPASQAFVRMSRDPRVPARHLSREVRRAMEILGMQPDPAVLDVLFGADVPPLTRLSLALRAGRFLAGGRGEPVTRFVTGQVDPSKRPIPAEFRREETLRLLQNPDELSWILDGLSPAIRDRIETWFTTAKGLAEDDEGRDLELIHALLVLASNLVQLPPYSILPPLGAAEDSMAVGLKAALNTTNEDDAMSQLTSMFRFLGGTFVSDESDAWFVCDEAAPEGHVERWQWFCSQVRDGRKRATELWEDITDPTS